MTLERVIFSGYGGQGLMFIGKVFANMMMERFEHVTFFPSYGSEVRGGTANCQVVLSSEDIASPIVDQADSLVLMNQSSVDRFLPALSNGGIALVNTSMAGAPTGRNCFAIPATDMAAEVGNIQCANVVIFGAYLRKRALVGFEEARDRIAAASSVMNQKAGDINAAAFTRGWEFFQ